jgi:tetratricopeptide (TPR) repeat protein
MAVSLDSLKKTIKKNKGRSQALAWLADMELATGEFESAMNHVDAALAASPSDVPAMLVRAKILTIQQDFAGSISEYKKVLAKDPFCLSAHKKMGESYDKLGKTAERNACFRRVHDMDPLDPFWKEEYDILTEEEQAAMVAPPMDDDSSFTMDMDSDNAEVNGEENVFANLAASISNADEESNSSMDDLLKSLNSASGENAESTDETQDQTFDGNVLSTSEVSSAITGILGGDDDLDTTELNENESAGATSNLAAASLFSTALASSALAASSQDEAPKSEETFNIEDQPIDAESKATNVDDAFSSLLGDDELPEEASAENLSLDDKPAEENISIDEWSPTPEKPKEEENATNVDDAFSSLLGDDELPEENNAEESSGGLFEKSADAEFSLDEAPAAETSPTEEGSIPTTHMEFSDDEVASVSEEPSSEDLNLDEIQTKEEDKATNVNDAFSSIFGDDELPEEKPLEETVAETSTEEAPLEETPLEDLPAEESSNETFAESLEAPAEEIAAAEPLFEEPAAEEPTNEESSNEESFGGLFEKSADADFSLSDEPAETANESGIPSTHMDFSDVEDNIAEASVPAAETEEVLVEPAEETQPEEVAQQSEEVAASSESFVAKPEETSSVSEDLSVSVDGAFDALFGDETATESAEATTETAPETVAETAAEPAKEEGDVAQEMGGAFASMFGDDDELSLPGEKVEETADAPVETALSQEATSAKIEEESVKDSVDESFDSIFGAADDLPEEKSEVAASDKAEDSFELVGAADFVADQSEQPAETPVKEVAAAAPSADLDSIDSEVSNAFKGLFDEDDSLPESDEPSNKGVDYLMSGDSDDEVTASLIDNADAPLSRGAADLDESLNTATLADIYMEQGVYNKALEIYSDLAKKNPNNPEIKSRLEEVEKLCREKFGEA